MYSPLPFSDSLRSSTRRFFLLVEPCPPIMQQVNVALSMEDWDRLQKILPAGQTVYSFAKEALLGRIREAEKNGPSSLGPSAIVLEMVAALRHRKWHLYQREDYSD